MCAANLQRRPYPPFQPGLVYDGLGELEVWDAAKGSRNAHEAGGSNSEKPAGSKCFVSILTKSFDFNEIIWYYIHLSLFSDRNITEFVGNHEEIEEKEAKPIVKAENLHDVIIEIDDSD